MNNIQKAAVIGCGFVGSSIAFTLMQSGIFSELVLIDANRDKAEGEAMDLSHGLPFTHPMDIRAGDYDDVADCALVIVTAGAGQKPGETRLDLVHKNVAIFRSIIPEIARRNRDAILLIVSNPVDVLTWAAWKLSGYPANRVLGSGTVLDTARLKYLLGERLGVDSRSVHAFIIGEHGDSELAVWSGANVSGISLDHFCELRGYYEHDKADEWLQREVRDHLLWRGHGGGAHRPRHRAGRALGAPGVQPAPGPVRHRRPVHEHTRRGGPERGEGHPGDPPLPGRAGGPAGLRRHPAGRGG